MSSYLKSTLTDSRLHQYFNSIQFKERGLLTLKEASRQGLLKLVVAPGQQVTASTSSVRFTEAGERLVVPVDLGAVIDPLGNGSEMTVEEALAKECIRLIMKSLVVGYAVV